MSDIDLSPLFTSLRAGIISTLFAFVLGIIISLWVLHMNKKLAYIVDTIITLPLVLPPTVAGFFLLLLFSMKRPLGQFLFNTYGVKIVLSFAGCVIAAFVISFPLMYKNAKAAFEQVDSNLVQAARTLGMSEYKICVRILIPCARPGIVSGIVLTFTRALGEYGATVMLAGNIKGKTQTMSTAIAAYTAAGNYAEAGVWVAVLVVLAFVILFIINLLSHGRRKRG